MAILLNTLVFSAFIYWFRKQVVINKKESFLGIILLFLLASFIAFVLSLFAEHDYLDGLQGLIAGGISISLFWISITAIIIHKNLSEKTTQRMAMDLVQTLPLLLIPFLIWLLMSNMSFKIGG